MNIDVRGQNLSLPDSLRIGVHDFKVVDNHPFRERSDLSGQCDHGTREIRIRRLDSGGCVVSGTNLLVTYLHELLHAIDRVYGDGTVTDGDKGELAISCLSEGLAQVLIDNGMMVIGEQRAVVDQIEKGKA